MPHILRRISPFRFQLRPNGSFVDGVEEASLSGPGVCFLD
jgi:hypothetical protein